MNRKKIKMIIMVVIITSTIGINKVKVFADVNTETNNINREYSNLKEVVDIPDENLKIAINKQLGQSESDNITKEQLKGILSLNLVGLNISNLEGIQYCSNLTSLNLRRNNVSDISQVKDLVNLTILNLQTNKISDISYIKNLTKLKTLSLMSNNIKDISVLSGLTQLSYLNLGDNKIKDIDSISNLKKLTTLTLSQNNISNITSLVGLSNLKALTLEKQIISLDEVVGYGTVEIKNNIIDIDGSVVTPKHISDAGKYDLNTKKIKWINIYASTTRTYTFDKEIKIGNALCNFSGQVSQPIRYENTVPVITAENKIIKAGSKFDLMVGVSATDKEDGNVTKDIKVIENTVNTNKPGTYKVVYEVTDSQGAKTRKTIIVTVVSNDKPVISGADNVSITEGTAFDSMAGVTAVDTEDGNITKDIKVSGSVDTNKPGKYEVTYTVTDSDGNTITVKRVVTVNPKMVEINNAPVIKAENKTIKVGSKFDPMTEVSATDKEDGNITNKIKVIENTVNVNKPGTYKVVYEVTDSQGAKTIKTITITVVSNDKPVISGADNVSITEGTAFDPMAGVTAVDTEDGNITKDIKVSGSVDTNKPGKYEVTYTVTDSDGNTITVKRVVTVNPKMVEINNAPVIKAENKTIKVGSKFDPMTEVSATDKEDGNITNKIKVIENTVNVNKPGTYKVVYEVTDSQGAKTIKTITITVVSNDKPVISGADNVSITEGTAFDPMAGVTAVDTEDGNITKDIKVSGSVDTNKPGKYEVTYTVTDSDGNIVTVKRSVTVNPKMVEINNAPVIKAENKTIKVGSKFDPMTEVSATDKEDGNITNKIKVIENTVNVNKPGTYKVVYEVTDSQGAKTIKTITITVVSNDKPVISGADNVSITEGTAFDPMAGVTAVDTEDGNITKDIKVSGSVDTNKPGKYEVTYTVTDSDGNIVTVKRSVTVNPKMVEINNAPVIKAENKTIKVGSKFDPMTEVSATDKEDGNITNKIKVIENTVNVNKPGTYKVVYEVTDSQGAKTIKTITITVVSNDKPVISGADNVSITEGTAFDPMAGVTAVDTEDGNITKDIKVSGSVDTNKPGKYEVTYTVTDSDGNIVTVKRSVTVNPKMVEINNAPVITAENKIIKAGSKFDLMVGVSATDKEDGNVTKDIKVIENTVNTNKSGTYKVVYEVTDSQGAKTRKTIIVTVVSNDKPVISGADNVSITEGTAFDSMAGVTAVDTEDGNITKDIKVSGSVDTNKPGKYEVTYTVTDSDGNTITVKRVVTVNPKMVEINNAPVIKAENKTIKVGSKFDPMTEVSATDKEDGNITNKIKVIENTVNVNKPGTYKVVYEVTDSQGAKTIKTIIITVENNDKYIENESTNNSDDKQVTLPATGSTSSLPIVGSILVAIGGLFTSKKKNDKK